jgi:hypothetical protein
MLRCETNSRTEYGNLFGIKDPNSDLTSGFSNNKALDHDAFRVREFLAKFITKVDHPLYSPELITCDLGLFPKLRKVA